MQYDLSNQVIVDYLRRCERLTPPLRIELAPDIAPLADPVLPHRHTHWEIKLTVPVEGEEKTPRQHVMILIPPGRVHESKKGEIPVSLRCGFQHFGWNMPLLGHNMTPEHDSHEAATVMALLESCRCCLAETLRGAELNRLLGATLLEALAEFWSRARNTQSNHTPEEIAVDYIDAHLALQDLTLDKVAAYVGCSLRQLHYRFRRKLGFTPGKYIMDSRMRLAAKLLAEPDCGIVAAAKLCGFADRDYFSRVFKHYHGVPPAAYRQKNIR